ncbi:pleckstrin domain-containing 2, partial [Brachionus plicatilis]
MKKQNEQQKIRAYERIRRPISPIRTEPGYSYRPTIKQNIRARQDITGPNQILPINPNQIIELQDYQQPVIHPATNLVKNEAESVLRRPPIQDSEVFFILKELVMTERTYKKDLELVTILFKQFADKQNFSFANLNLFDLIYSDQALLPLGDFHSQFLTELEARFQKWTDKNFECTSTSLALGDLLSTLERSFKFYNFYIQKYDLILNELEQLCKKNKKFDAIYKEFESLKICYLPF